MKTVHTQEGLRSLIEQARAKGETIGLVPTMGALHEGHASLVKRSVAENDLTIVSVFVNPTQFNDKNDLKSYPRDIEADSRLLESIGADILFAPSVEEMYPEPDERRFSYPPTDTVMEGARRPGHFNGVCQIVSKLFLLTGADRAYFGEKDFQQIAVVRAMTTDLKIPIEIRPCPIVREKSGLAMSSRNMLLSEEERAIAANIWKTLKQSQTFAETHTLAQTCQYVVDTLNAVDGLNVEYYEIVDGITLASLRDWDEADNIVGCITVRCGSNAIRLIDNVRYK